jgi:hypothetical protein
VDQDPNVVCGTSSTSFGCGLHRWKKCSTIANRFVAKLDTILQKFDNEEKKDIVQRIMEHESFKALLPKYITSSKGLEKAL